MPLPLSAFLRFCLPWVLRGMHDAGRPAKLHPLPPDGALVRGKEG